MPKKLPNDLVVLRDSREQEGWFWEPEEKKSGRCCIANTEVVGLKQGDYTLKGLEDTFVIERKFGLQEVFGNYYKKEYRERFERELERMQDIAHKYILIETNLNNDTLGLSVPQMRNGPPVKRLISWLTQIQIEYGVHIEFVGDAGKARSRIIFEQMARKYLR